LRPCGKNWRGREIPSIYQKTHSDTHFNTYFDTHFDRPGEPVAEAEPETTKKEPLQQDILTGVIETLRKELERQGDTGRERIRL